jgi:hypothetical protein
LSPQISAQALKALLPMWLRNSCSSTKDSKPQHHPWNKAQASYCAVAAQEQEQQAQQRLRRREKLVWWICQTWSCGMTALGRSGVTKKVGLCLLLLQLMATAGSAASLTLSLCGRHAAAVGRVTQGRASTFVGEAGVINRGNQQCLLKAIFARCDILGKTSCLLMASSTSWAHEFVTHLRSKPRVGCPVLELCEVPWMLALLAP